MEFNQAALYLASGSISGVANYGGELPIEGASGLEVSSERERERESILTKLLQFI